ncbi:MAG: histidine kinase [Dehalococcoidia bacterium]|nr:histidine kinase [Dehalococcoidia bacterium]
MTPTKVLATELRDGLLQDLVAAGMLIEVVRRSVDDPARLERTLDTLSRTLQCDQRSVRSVIDRLGLVDEREQ